MITYEITTKIGSHLTGEYERYMREQHIPDLLETGAFTSANFSVSTPGQYQARYEARSREDLDTYLNEHASRLRSDLLKRFPEGIEITRYEWNIIESWKC